MFVYLKCINKSKRIQIFTKKRKPFWMRLVSSCTDSAIVILSCFVMQTLSVSLFCVHWIFFPIIWHRCALILRISVLAVLLSVLLLLSRLHFVLRLYWDGSQVGSNTEWQRHVTRTYCRSDAELMWQYNGSVLQLVSQKVEHNPFCQVSVSSIFKSSQLSNGCQLQSPSGL